MTDYKPVFLCHRFAFLWYKYRLRFMLQCCYIFSLTSPMLLGTCLLLKRTALTLIAYVGIGYLLAKLLNKTKRSYQNHNYLLLHN